MVYVPGRKANGAKLRPRDKNWTPLKFESRLDVPIHYVLVSLWGKIIFGRDPNWCNANA